MSIAAHLQELKRKHENLSAQVERSQKSPGVCNLQIRELKKQKLNIKDQMQRLENS